MKSLRNLIVVLLVVTGMISCDKNNDLKDETLIGKWKLVQVFNGDINNGNFTWSYVDDIKEIEFSANGNYSQTVSKGQTTEVCNGTYHLYSGNKIEINSSCSGTRQTFVLSKQIKSDIIIDKPLKDGVIREKFIRISNK